MYDKGLGILQLPGGGGAYGPEVYIGVPTQGGQIFGPTISPSLPVPPGSTILPHPQTPPTVVPPPVAPPAQPQPAVVTEQRQQFFAGFGGIIAVLAIAGALLMRRGRR